MRFRILATVIGLAFCVNPASVFAQGRDQTLADIRQELVILNGQINGMRRELSTTGSANTQTGSGTVLQRVDNIEAELRRLTGSVEQLQFRVDRVVKDGTNRIGDLEFRLVELEGGDVTQLGKTSTLGGGDVAVTTATPTFEPTTTPNTVELAVSEQDDFDIAVAAFQAGDHAVAADRFLDYVAVYPGGPLVPQANFWRGEALAAQGDWSNAARSYLESFSGATQGPKAANALYKLGVSLGKLGQVSEACRMLTEVEVRYPVNPVLEKSRTEHRLLGCV